MSLHSTAPLDILFIDQPLSLNERYSPLAFEMLAAYLEPLGLSCGVMGFYNRNIAAVEEVHLDYIVEQLEGLKFRMVGITLSGFDMIEPSHQLAQSIKARFPGIKFIVGGFFTTFYPVEILENNPAFDYLIVGDGEKPLYHLLTTPEKDIPGAAIAGLAYREPITGKVIYTLAGPQMDLGQLPLPINRFTCQMVEAFGRNVAIAGLCTSKGCRNNCSFCSVAETSNLLTPRQRRRTLSAEKSLERIASLVEAGAKVIRVIDTDFIGGDFERSATIAEGILKNGWNLNLFIDVCFSDLDEGLFRLLAKAGFNGLVGIESLASQDRKLFHKIPASVKLIYEKMEAIENTGFHLYSSFILYNPRSTLDDLELNLAFIRRFRRGFKCKTFFTYLRVDKNPFLSSYLERRGVIRQDQAELFRSFAAIQDAFPKGDLDRLQLLLPYSLEIVPHFQQESTSFVFHNMYQLLYWTWFYQFRLILYHNMDRSCFLFAPPTDNSQEFFSCSDALFDLCADTMQSLITRARARKFEIEDLKVQCEQARSYWKDYVEQEARLGGMSPYLALRDFTPFKISLMGR